jgi:hypothetical protein
VVPQARYELRDFAWAHTPAVELAAQLSADFSQPLLFGLARTQKMNVHDLSAIIFLLILFISSIYIRRTCLRKANLSECRSPHAKVGPSMPQQLRAVYIVDIGSSLRTKRWLHASVFDVFLLEICRDGDRYLGKLMVEEMAGLAPQLRKSRKTTHA